jgi:NADPH:quinone reductase-like Zn-dependent oxidoreductase
VGPAADVADAAGRAARKGLAGPGAQPIQGDGDQAHADVAFLVLRDRVRGPAAELLDQPRDVQGGDVGPQAAVAVGVGGEVGWAAFGLLGQGGRFYPFGMASGSFAPVTPELAQEHGVSVLRGGPANAEESAALSRAALAEAAAGRLRPVIGQEFDLARAAAAHAAIEARATTGKTLLTVPR